MGIGVNVFVIVGRFVYRFVDLGSVLNDIFAMTTNESLVVFELEKIRPFFSLSHLL